MGAQSQAQVESQTGRTRGGAPLAWSRAPAERLRPWFYWWSVSEGELPPGVRVKCGMFVDHSCLRIIYRDPWTADTLDGQQVWDPGAEGKALYFGPQSRCMPLAIEGRYIAITLHFTAGAPSVLGGPPQSEMLDRIVEFDSIAEVTKAVHRHAPLDEPYENWIIALEKVLGSYIDQIDAAEPDPLSLAFERQALVNPHLPVEDFCRRAGVGRRTLERIIKRDFGVTPKFAMRRARAMDMGAALLGVAREEDEAGLALRYTDQSHLIREIKSFFDLRPKDLKTGAHPFLRLSLEVRQRCRLDALKQLHPDEIGPWRDPGSEPVT
ncbi:helix-turn-helix domain-containing protein [Paraurantiacibacter namhicola]|uniref:Helix-turn-helix domain protein n=1 Tax=Paraurantiacibacter namhicola TaxID=645517 RepID=A0A1C7D583_9SPHN|nr:AraC family transcriptional regulator [Paraurantiacibacter namhicola]ANU06627.1 Helix-turn-helix domain protein [Paraurantiacibacter namhicola]